ncbi:MAG: mechanosensitive ion channel family protein, partial [Gemmatimonadota bacterium]|nr:mechanosensitive ion channel family protein [Gemmatimonadota bacterium]
KPLLAIVILSISWTVGGMAAAIVQVPQGANGAIPSARILSTAARAFVFVVGILVALQTLGVSVAPILTALGVGGLAVGLALQDTLANLFAGFQILVSRQVRPGDFIQLGSGEKGFVEDITWRNTTIRQLPNNIVIVPNAKLSQQITINYSLPETEQAVLVQVGVSYDEDLPTVERITIEVARTIQRDVDGAVRDFEPFTRYHTFADSSINFSVIMRGTEYTSNFLMKHEFVKRLHARYKAEGITIPFPQRTVHLHQAPPEPPPRA